MTIKQKLVRLISRRGESLLTAAVKDLDKIAGALEKAENALARKQRTRRIYDRVAGFVA